MVRVVVVCINDYYIVMVAMVIAYGEVASGGTVHGNGANGVKPYHSTTHAGCGIIIRSTYI